MLHPKLNKKCSQYYISPVAIDREAGSPNEHVGFIKTIDEIVCFLNFISTENNWITHRWDKSYLCLIIFGHFLMYSRETKGLRWPIG